MIESLPMIKLVIDIALSCTIFYLAARVGRGRGPSAAKLQALQALEESLSSLLRDASGANGDLQRALQKEQKKLEELLFDIETVEQRVNKGFDDARAAYRSLKKIIEHSAVAEKRLSAAYQRQDAQGQESRQALVPQNSANIRQRSALASQVEMERVSNEQKSSDFQHTRQAEIQPSFTSPNRESLEPKSSMSLRGQVQRESVVPGKRTQLPNAQQSLEDIFAHCEELLRAGQSMQEVAARVNLSVDEVERLQSLMSLEEGAPIIPGEIASERAAQRSTLGALSRQQGVGSNPIARSRQVIS